MVKNCILWLTFSLLLTVTSATACFAGKTETKIILPAECLIDNNINCEHMVITHREDSVNSEKEKEPVVNNEASPSILSSNFIFYIIYKYRFMEISNSSKDLDSESEDKVSSPIQNFSNRIVKYLYSIFEDKL